MSSTRPEEGLQPSKAPDYSIAVLQHALDVLEVLDDAPEPLGVTDISRKLGATKSATYRILVNLEGRGYLVKDPVTARYAVGSRLLRYGLRVGSRATLVQAARPRLEALSSGLSETANLGVIDANKVLYVDIVESPHDLRMAARVGARDDMHSTALGKAMLAFLPEPERDALLRGPLRKKTSRTIANREQLIADLDTIRSTGLAVDYGENEMAASCFGVPVFGPDGGVIAAISVAGPEGRMKVAGVEHISRVLMDAARSVTEELGGTWPSFGSEESLES